MKINLVQYSPEWENKEKNRSKILSLLNDNCMESTIVFPEMTLTGFTMKASENSERLFGDSFKFFSDVATQYKSFVLTGVIEKQDTQFFNSLLCINPEGNLVSVYRKIHPFSYSSENKFYTAGEQPSIVEIGKWRTGLSICYDLRFPELYRLYGRERTELLVNIANWPETRIEHWRALLKARAIENQCYMIGVNRTGSDPKLNYTGFSSIFDPMGKEIAALDTEEGIISGVLDLKYVNEIRNKLPFLDDMVLI
jgi:omega-amidase